MNDIEKIKRELDLLAMVQADTELKKTASTGGGEWSGACPLCGGDDRFSVQPHHPDGARWFCRVCGDNQWHDVIDYHQRRTLCTFQEALVELAGGATTPVPLASEASTTEKKKPIFPPLVEDEPLWQEQARNFIEESARVLWSDRGRYALDYLRAERGLEDATIKDWWLGLNPEEKFVPRSHWGLSPNSVAAFTIPTGLVIPCAPDKIRYIKIRQPRGLKPKYKNIEGSKGWLFGAETLPGAFDVFIFEGELDTLVAWQEGWAKNGFKVGFGSFPCNQEFRAGWLRYTQDAKRYIISHDMDAPGRASCEKLKGKFGNRAKIATLPETMMVNGEERQINDLSDFHMAGGDVFEWMYDQTGVKYDKP